MYLDFLCSLKAPERWAWPCSQFARKSTSAFRPWKCTSFFQVYIPSSNDMLLESIFHYIVIYNQSKVYIYMYVYIYIYIYIVFLNSCQNIMFPNGSSVSSKALAWFYGAAADFGKQVLWIGNWMCFGSLVFREGIRRCSTRCW